MNNGRLLLALAACTLLGSAASAQSAPEPLSPEQMAAKAAALEAQVQALQKEIDSIKKQLPAVTPSWKGAPQFQDKAGGWSFKPRGRIQYDAGWVGRPSGVTDRGLGFSNELRRLRFGAEGTVPGGFGYKFEVDFADNNAEILDAILSYEASDQASIAIGQHNPFQSLEELTSSRFLSFMERAAFTDAFNFERRVGLSATFSQGPVTASAGVFTDSINDLTEDDNNSLGGDARLVFAPKLGDAQLHFGASGHFRNNRDLVETGVTTRYRQRPFVHTSDSRFLATPALTVEKETSYGLEAAAIRGPLHAAAEVHWLRSDRRTGPTPTFFGGYAEVGYYLTGETRGYKAGVFDRTKVRRPLGDGGFGAVQLNLRYDHLDLNDAGIIGGKQRGYEASLIWIPQDHVRFYLNYGRLQYEDAAIVATGGDRNYGIDVFGARAQVDF